MSRVSKPSRAAGDSTTWATPPLAVVVEDDLTVANLYTRLLQGQGVAAVISVTGDDAMELVERHRPDLVILDLMLPGNYGTDIAIAIKAKWHKLPIMMVSGLPEMAVAQDAWRSRAFAYLTKPFDIAEFNAAVQQALTKPADWCWVAGAKMQKPPAT